MAGGAALAAGARLRPRADASAGTPGLAAWGLLVAALLAWEAASWLQHPRAAHPTLSSLANDALDSHGARAVAFLGWLAAGVGLARR